MVDDLVSVVVLNWNKKEITAQCVDSLLTQKYSMIEIIIVDNASTDGSVDYLKMKYPMINIVENEKNLGFDGGNNSGIKKTKGEYVLILNNDTILESNCIQELVLAIKRDSRYGAAATKIFLMANLSYLDAAGIIVYPDGLAIGRGRMNSGNSYDKEEEVFFASDCACLYRKAMIDDLIVNGEFYDEDFFAYADETDLGWRAQMRGWKTIYVPKAIVYHMHSASTSDYDPFKIFLVERNRMWVVIKNFPLFFLIIAPFFTLSRYGYKLLAAFRGRGAVSNFIKKHPASKLILIVLKAHVSALIGLPRMLKKRAIIQKRRIISYKKIFELLKIYGITAKDISNKE